MVVDDIYVKVPNQDMRIDTREIKALIHHILKAHPTVNTRSIVSEYDVPLFSE